ncbi:MAG: hypothetical protein K2H13_01100 [Eubacterium sp.]|nr:hypothetical protein [Eubacterium sp.]
MKKYLSIFIIIITLLSLCACSTDNNKNTDNNSVQSSKTDQSEITDTEPTGDTDKDDVVSDSEDVVLIRYFRQRKELPYNDETKSILNDIKECTDKQKTEFEHKIGSISIIHNNNDEVSEDFANIYMGEDDNVYARYINNSDGETAYKLDIEALGLE